MNTSIRAEDEGRELRSKEDDKELYITKSSNRVFPMRKPEKLQSTREIEGTKDKGFEED